MLFVLWNEPFHRPTQDIDFAAQGTAGPDDIVPALQHVCRIAVADGVVFGADHMTVSQIRGATDEGGIRIRFPATVDVAPRHRAGRCRLRLVAGQALSAGSALPLDTIEIDLDGGDWWTSGLVTLAPSGARASRSLSQDVSVSTSGPATPCASSAPASRSRATAACASTTSITRCPPSARRVPFSGRFPRRQDPGERP